jgi:putative endonuclease
MDYYFYVIYSAKSKKYHVGSTVDLEDSLLWHNEGHSKFTKGGSPWTVVYKEIFPTRVSAFQREVEVKKKKSKKFIEELVNGAK